MSSILYKRYLHGLIRVFVLNLILETFEKLKHRLLLLTYFTLKQSHIQQNKLKTAYGVNFYIRLQYDENKTIYLNVTHRWKNKKHKKRKKDVLNNFIQIDDKRKKVREKQLQDQRLCDS